MLKSQKFETRSAPSPVSQMVVAAGLCALTAGIIETIVNRWLIGWVVIVGLAAVCVFFLAYGIVLLVSRLPKADNKWTAPTHRRTVGIDPLHMDTESCSQDATPNSEDGPESLRAKNCGRVPGICGTPSGLRQSI
jgi:hypothetical protein